MVSKSVICEKSRIAINVKFWVKTWCEFHLSAQRKSFDLWWWQIPHFKAYFKCNLKGLINLCRIIDCFTATEQNISLSNFESHFWAFVFYICDTKLIFILWPRSLASFWGVCHLHKSKDLLRADKWNSYHVLTQNLTLIAIHEFFQKLQIYLPSIKTTWSNLVPPDQNRNCKMLFGALDLEYLWGFSY